MKLIFEDDILRVVREPNDKKYYGNFQAIGESNLLYDVKRILNKQGFNLIKKRMYKDGHMVDDSQQYLRTAKPTGNPNNDIYIYNGHWATYGANDDFNKGEARLCIVRNIFNKG